MSFRFRRRGDVSEQSPQQEPFFQNATGQQQPFVDPAMYPQMGQHQGYDPNFNGNYGPQPYFGQPQQLQQPQQGPQVPSGYKPSQPFFHNNEENFYTQQQMQMMQGMQRHPQQPYANQQQPQSSGQNAYMYPVQASQLGNFQAGGYPPQGFQPQQPGYMPEDVRALGFWRESQPNSGFEELQNEQSESSPIRLLVAVAGVAIIAGLSWFAYKWAKSPTSDIPPLIHAETGPHKVHPDHRGGINIPYQDKLIYDRISDGNTAEPAERLLPPPELPMANQPQQAPIDQNQQMAQQQMYNNAPGYNAPANMQNAQGQQQPTVGQPQYQQQMPAAVPVPVVEAPVAAQSQESEPEFVAKPAKGNYFVQMVTVTSEADALSEWKRRQKKYNLKGMKSQIKEFETDDGKTFYRLLLGPFTEKVKAMKFAVKMDGSKVVQITE